MQVLERIRAFASAADLHSNDPEAIESAHRSLDAIEIQIGNMLESATLIAESAVLVGIVAIGPNCIIGPNCSVGPFAFLRRRAALFPDVIIGHTVEVDTAILFESAKISHSGFIGTSTIGRHANLAFGFATTTRRLDEREVRISCGGMREPFSSPRKYHGAVVGRNVKTGARVTLMPGSTLVPDSRVPPGAIVKGLWHNR